jgi:hypothetical protein
MEDDHFGRLRSFTVVQVPTIRTHSVPLALRKVACFKLLINVNWLPDYGYITLAMNLVSHGPMHILLHLFEYLPSWSESPLTKPPLLSLLLAS